MKIQIALILALSVLMVIAQNGRQVEIEKLQKDYWVCKSASNNSLIVEEDSTVTLIDFPRNEVACNELNNWIKSNINKPIGQLIFTTKENVDSNLVSILNPMLVHDFYGVLSLLGGARLLQQKADVSVEIGSFTVFDATPRLSIHYPSQDKDGDNLVVFSDEDGVVFLGDYLNLDSKSPKKARTKVSAGLLQILEITSNSDKYIQSQGEVKNSKEIESHQDKMLQN